MGSPLIFWNSYQLPPKEGRGRRLHETRDGGAFAQLAPLLYAMGFEFGGMFFNYAEHEPQ